MERSTRSTLRRVRARGQGALTRTPNEASDPIIPLLAHLLRRLEASHPSVEIRLRDVLSSQLDGLVARGEVVVVEGAYEVSVPAGARVVRCAEWERGPGASLRCGLEALAAGPDGELVRVEEPDEQVLIVKEGRSLHVRVHGKKGEDVSVNVPFRVALSALPDSEGRISALDLAGALGTSYASGAYLALTTIPAPDQHQIGFDATDFCGSKDELVDDILALAAAGG